MTSNVRNNAAFVEKLWKFWWQKNDRNSFTTRVTLKLLTPPPLSERKRKIRSSTWDSVTSKCSLWGSILLWTVSTMTERKKNECSWCRMSTIAQPWTAPVSVLEHSWPTFSLFLPVQSSLFTLPRAECFVSSSVQNAKEGVNHFRVTLEYVGMDWNTCVIFPWHFFLRKLKAIQSQ